MRLMAESLFRKVGGGKKGRKSDKAATFSSAGSAFFVFRLQLELEQSGNCVSSPCAIASYCNREEGEVGSGGAGRRVAADTPGDIQTDSAPRALMEETIKNHDKSSF